MRALKLLVIVLGVLIIVGVVALVGVMASRVAGRGAPAGFGRSRIELPAGASVGAMQAAGDRLVLRLDLPGGEQQLLVVDPGSGKALGTIELHREQ